jgi:serine/threonine-protein kinase SRPK3
MYDNFIHKGPNGSHYVFILELMGDSLLHLLAGTNYSGISINILKPIAKHILLALDYIHSKNIIHTDLKLENILISTHPDDIPNIPMPKPGHLSKTQSKRFKQRLKKYKKAKTKTETETNLSDHVIKISDFGNGCWTHKHFTSNIQAQSYRAPEVILNDKYDTNVDMWSVACIIFELCTGTALFNPSGGLTYDKTEDHLANIIELLGPILGKEHKHLDENGETKNIRNLKYLDLPSLLETNYMYSKKNADEISAFILPMLAVDSKDRATAAYMLEHFGEWLESI